MSNDNPESAARIDRDSRRLREQLIRDVNLGVQQLDRGESAELTQAEIEEVKARGRRRLNIHRPGTS